MWRKIPQTAVVQRTKKLKPLKQKKFFKLSDKHQKNFYENWITKFITSQSNINYMIDHRKHNLHCIEKHKLGHAEINL